MKIDRAFRARLPEHGRIRIGAKGAGGVPTRLDTFRFTSQDEAAIRQLAHLYGGEPRPWVNAPRKGEWEVITDATRIPVLLPPAPLGEGVLETPRFELWSGGGRLRSCDGTIVDVTNRGGSDRTPCICIAQQSDDCTPVTQLVVALKEVRFGGGWRIKSQSWATARELPGVVAMLQAMQAPGIELILREERCVRNGQTRIWKVPMLTTSATPSELVARGGGKNPFAIDPASAAIGSDAPELVATSSGSEFEDAVSALAGRPERRERSVDEVRKGLVLLVSRRRTNDAAELTNDERKDAIGIVNDVQDGLRRIIGFTDDGMLQVSRRRSDAA